jgi:uncharacterized protein YbjQ (UPF0145 family)
MVDQVEAVRCKGTVGRVAGTAESAMEFLRQEAALLEADAVLNVQCQKVPFVNNCWAAAKCEGMAVKWGGES